MFRKTLVGVAAALALAPVATAATPAPFISPHPAHVRQMHWVDRHGAAAPSAGRFGSTAVIGLTSMHDLPALRERYGFTHPHAIPQLKAAQVRIDRTHLRALLAQASTDSRIRYVSPVDGPSRHSFGMPNDPLLSAVDPGTALPYEWQFGAAHVDRALDYSQGSPAIVVGTIDTGLADLPDLAGKVDSRWSIATDGSLAPVAMPEGNDEVGHGSAVASLIAANVDDGFGMAGFGGASHVVAVRIDDHGWSDTATAVALAKLDSLGVRIVNMSFGGYPPNSPILVDAIHKAAADGMLLIAATGNNNLLGRPAYVAYPAAALQPAGGARSYGLAVGASGLDGQPASFSNWGRHLSLLAPGNYAGTCSGVLVAMAPLTDMTGSCYPNWVSSSGGRYAYVPGTSFASPEVAGIAALIWAARPQLKNYQVADIIKQSASHAAGTSWTPTTGCGVLDAGAALALATSRSAAQWAAQSTPDERPCSADGGRPAAWPERDPAPTAQALPARGVWGKALKLQFRVGEDTYQVVPAITVRKNSVAAARLAGGLMPVKPGDAYGLAWRAPRAPTKARLSFCVTLRTTSGKKGAPTCAPISLR